jgi:hypothetical protein
MGGPQTLQVMAALAGGLASAGLVSRMLSGARHRRRSRRG